MANYVSIALPRSKQEVYKVKIKLNNTCLPGGKYTVSFTVGHYDFNQKGINYDAVHNVLAFEVKNITKGVEYNSWQPNWGATLHNLHDIIASVD